MNTHLDTIALGDYQWKINTRTLYYKGIKNGSKKDTISLTQKQFDLLSCLLEASPSTIDKEGIIEKVWGTKHISSESLPQLINRTRQVLGDDDKTIVANKPGIGYLLNFSLDIPLEADNLNPVNDISNVNDVIPIQPIVTLNKKLKTQSNLNRAWSVLLLSLLILTCINAFHAGSSIYYKYSFKSVMQSTPYPLFSQSQDGNVVHVQIGKNECSFTKGTNTLDCS
ncbi:winged helix-turn-helix domain-containing protein [Vibrio sinensis]|nr:helix-turn-helix domain-containing protein [Vibrio sinensis]